MTVTGNTKSANRVPESPAPAIDRYRSQHLKLAERQVATKRGRANVTVDEAESPLAWLARRRGRNGRALIEPHQFQAGASAALASARMRSTIDRRPFERCGVRPSRNRMCSNKASASVSRISFARLPE